MIPKFRAYDGGSLNRMYQPDEEDEDTQTTAIGFYLSFLNVTPATYAPFEKMLLG